LDEADRLEPHICLNKQHYSDTFAITICHYSALNRVATHLENLKKSGNLRMIREKSGKIGKVSEMSGKMCSLMHEIWPFGSQESH